MRMAGPAGREELARFAEKVGRAVADLLPDHISIIWKGSAHKPWEGPFDFLPGLSDVDIHVYREQPLADPWGLRRAVLEAAGPVPFDTPLQLLVLDVPSLPGWWTILPGTFRVLHGSEPPTSIPATATLLERDRYGLAGAATDSARVSSDILGLADHELWGYLRSVRSLFPPALYRAVSLWTGRPERVWSLNKSKLLAFAGEHRSLDAITEAAVGYFTAALGACSEPGNAMKVQQALQAGEHLLDVAAEWAAARPDAVVDRRVGEPAP